MSARTMWCATRSHGAAIVLLAAASAAPASAAPAPISLPPGFSIETWAAGVENARSLALGASGTVFVGTRSAGNVYAVRPQADGTRRVTTILRDLNMPNGIAFRDGSLYVAELHRIQRFDRIEERLDRMPAPVAIASLPRERHHGWRYLGFGPDGKLYVPIGAPCNVCEKDGYATIVRMNADGSGREIVARGVRNSVGFTWHPASGELWFTDNGRDMLGDEVPACELNRLARTGGNHFGFPFCHAGSVVDPEFGGRGRCRDTIAPVQALGPHVAPLGVRFYTGTQFPQAYRGQLFIAEHGSWNRSKKIGYRITLVRLDGNRAVGYETFASGWLTSDEQVLGRPVDLLVMPDGSMLVSDDQSGAIYRISYQS